MSNEVLTPNAAGEKSAVESSDNLAFGMYALRRRGGKTQVQGEPKISTEVINVKPTEPQPKAEQEDKQVGETQPESQNDTQAETVTENEPVSQEEADVLSKKEIDLESMSEAELRELADKLGSRAVARFGELTAKRKHAEEQLNALKQELANRESQKNPLETKRIENNPFADIDSVEKLQGKASEIDEAIEWAEDVLWTNEHLAADDIVAIVDGKEITKAQVRKVMRDAQKARKDFLPAQLSELQVRQQRAAAKQQLSEAIRTELDWMQGEDNDTRKQFEILRESPLLKQAIKAVPDLEPYMEYMVAHASNSIYGRKPVNETRPSARINPPSIQVSSSAQSEQPEPRAAKAVKDIQQRFSTSGATQDFIALRALQHSKRK
jgi:hypothetical protein